MTDMDGSYAQPAHLLDGSKTGSIDMNLTPAQLAEARAIVREKLQAQAAKDAALLANILSDRRPVSTSQLVRGKRLGRLIRRSARHVVNESVKRAARAKSGAGQPSKLMRTHEAIARHQTWLNNKEIRNGN